MELPLIPSCELDERGLSAQRERYRLAGEGASVIERTPRRLVVQISPDGAAALPNLVDVERQCCPFFEIDWQPGRRRFSIGVAEAEQQPALDAIAFALGV